MKIIIDKYTGKVLYATLVDFELIENEIAVDESFTEFIENPYYDFETKTFYDDKIRMEN